MQKFMRISSKPSKKTFSAQTEKTIRDIIFRAEKFKTKADEILSEYQLLPVVEASQIIENIIIKFHSVVGEICRRYDCRSTLKVNDEYDVQDLLRSLLRLYFDDIRDEEWTPSYAGKSTRIDFLLKKEQIAVETKMTRKGLDEKKLGDELIIDIAHYQKHPECRILYCLIYDPEERISNPRGFERDLSEKHGNLITKVFVVPRRT